MSQAWLVPQHHTLPPFPAVVRDLSLVVPRSLSWADLSSAASASAGPLLSSIEYLDTFHGGNLPDDQQSVHFGLTFRHSQRTLTGGEVDQAVKSVVDACASRFGARIRG
jgi:phenylalanyl-tRNA synthetase beta chain